MLIFVFHDFGATGPGSIMCQQVVDLAKKNNVIAFAPTYPTNNPHLAHIYLTDYITEKLTGISMCFIGIGLGGYWARHLTRLHPGSHLILINPMLQPWDTLQQYTGQNYNSVNGNSFELSPNDIIAHYIYRVEQDRNDLHATIIIASDDNIVDSNKTIEIFTNREHIQLHSIIGGHRFLNNRNNVIDIICDAIFPKPEEDDNQPKDKN